MREPDQLIGRGVEPLMKSRRREKLEREDKAKQAKEAKPK